MDHNKNRSKQIRKKIAETNFRYNRFLLLRYLLAVFFFVNLYWVLASLLSKAHLAFIISLLLLIVCGFAISEHVKLYGDESDHVLMKLHYNRIYHLFQLVVNSCLFIIAITNLGFEEMYPFLINNFQTRLLIICIVLLGIVCGWSCLYRIHVISQRKDKYYQYIKKYKKSIS
ncbi:hypothetical protein [Tetragenococcus halophilus]|uniref:PTS cellobiose transporter subunit IIA n=1 Tax=Tetragenococcus halophilus TaxID=51669 RepID=A0AB37D700_TETHA|nr:hypothetical protein [Tetragenococcus halophilus]MCO8287275.1 hypothetical protein [Tetragenococcus halophilus]QGP77332.1 hypothetical protein GLW17_11325 [Tetragenococcus halophilus]WJS81189.1 hypothetical protein KFZ55_07770 [Tetragenococcus halophilus]